VGLYVIGAAEVLLLFIGIHNAWDAAVWITMNLEPQADDADGERKADVSPPAAPPRPAAPPADRS